jgi:hypothetical protein
MRPEERAARAIRYVDLMRGGELGEAFDAIEKEYTAELLNCRDRDERERLWLAVQVVRKVRTHFAQAVASGRVGMSDIQALRRVK